MPDDDDDVDEAGSGCGCGCLMKLPEPACQGNLGCGGKVP